MAAKRRSKSKKSQAKRRKDDPAQSETFLKMAKALEADESGQAFERVLDVLARKARQK